MATAMTSLATYTLPNDATGVTFSNIPSTDAHGNTIKDLVAVVHGSFDVSGRLVALRFNGDTGSSYDSLSLYGTGTTPVSGRLDSATYMYGNWYQGVANEPFVYRGEIMDAKNTSKYKSVYSRFSSTSSGSAEEMNYGKWKSTAAITSVQIYVNSTQNFNAGTTFSLYAIAG